MAGVLAAALVAAALLAIWLLLAGTISPGAVLVGTVVAIGGTLVLATLGPPPLRLRRIAAIPPLMMRVLVEVVRSNNAVARIILQRDRTRPRRSGFVRVPLDMRSPYGLAALAAIVTATPGTIWVDYDSSDGTMLLHVLDLIDEEAWARIIKDKWERRLMEIFE
jgi:multicomponent K+:H+ antiporter subunit E